MRTRKWVVMTLVLFIVAIGNAKETAKMNVVPVETFKAMIAFESPCASPLEITITNHDGEILYYKRTERKQKEFRQVFDFKELGTGDFNVCLNFGVQSISRIVNVSLNKIDVGPAEKLYEPYFCMKKGKLNVSFLNVTKKAVYLTIMQDGEQVAGANLGKKMTMQKCVDLSNLEKGKYEVVLTDWFKEHRYEIQI